MRDIFVITEHLKGEFQDITFEMLGKARELANASGSRCIAVVFGTMKSKAMALKVADRIISLGGSDDYNPEAYNAAVKSVVQAKSPSLVLVGSTSMGIDIAAAVGTALNMPVVAFCCDIKCSNKGFTITSPLYGGKINVITEVNTPSVVSVLPGSFNIEESQTPNSPIVEDFAADFGLGRVRFKTLIEPSAADVDITRSKILVALGRGIGRRDGIRAAEKLADLLNADIACSRPLVDAGWMPKAYQVGKSGMIVKPKVYLALGISGAPEHVEGMKSSQTIIAVNSDKQAPIFDVAHFGMIEDLYVVCEKLFDKLE